MAFHHSAFPTHCAFKEVNSTIYKLQLKTQEEVEGWMIEYQNISKETWSISKTFKIPKDKPRNVFKRIYYCHFKTKRRQNTDQKRDKKSRNIDCPAKLFVTIQRFIPKSKCKTHKVEEDWPCIVEFRGTHNHRLHVAEALRERNVSPEVKAQIIELFERGHSASSAYHTYYSMKMSELGDNYENVAYDRYYFPTKNDITSLWKKNFKKHYGEYTGTNMLLRLHELLTFYETNDGTKFKIVSLDQQYAVVICTPIMQRVLELPQASEIMFVDATGNCDSQNHKVYFFLTQSVAGGLPMGCIISSSQKSSIFDASVNALLEILKIKIQPAVILTDDDLVERTILHKYWPKSKLFLCTFHVLKACWRWILTGKNGIPKDKSQVYYSLFRRILYSNTDEELENSKQIFFEECEHDNFKKYVSNMLQRINEWGMLYRKHFLLRGTDTNNYSEVMFRLLKDIPLERTKAFNLPQLADFIVSSFESYYKQRILDLLFGRESKIVSNRYIKKYDTECNIVSGDIEKMEFEVQSSNNIDVIYKVDMISCKCTCPIGFNGKYCKHQASVVKKYNILSSINNLSAVSKYKLYEIATGKTAPKEVFLPLQDDGMCIPSSSKDSNNSHTYIETSMDESPKKTAVGISIEKTEGDMEQSFMPSAEQVEDMKMRWLKFSQELTNNLVDDPVQFYPAINTFLENVERYAKTTNSLISGLHTAFKYNGNPSKNQKNRRLISRKGKKIPIQPTSVARRKI